MVVLEYEYEMMNVWYICYLCKINTCFPLQYFGDIYFCCYNTKTCQDSPARGTTGIEVGDVVTGINRHPVASVGEWNKHLATTISSDQIGFCVPESVVHTHDETIHHGKLTTSYCNLPNTLHKTSFWGMGTSSCIYNIQLSEGREVLYNTFIDLKKPLYVSASVNHMLECLWQEVRSRGMPKLFIIM